MVLTVLLCTLLVVSTTATEPELRPNIVVLIADDLGIGDISCYGNDSFRTTHLDRLASQGALLTHHLVGATVCTPSRTALLTGRYPVRSGMQEARHGPVVVRNVPGRAGLPADEVTFARALRDAGYRTQFVGKWHQGWSCERWEDQCHGPRGHGFDSFFGLPFSLMEEGEDGPVSQRRDEPLLRHVLPELMLADPQPPLRPGDCHRAAAELAWRLWLDTINQTDFRGGSTPRANWWGHTMAVEKFLNYQLVRDSTVVDWPYQLPFLLVHSFLHPHTPLFTAPEFRGVSGHSRYADNVLEMDWAVGQLLAALDAAGVADNTLVHFLSDHGGQLELVGPDGQREGGHNGVFRGGKAQGGAEGGLRVPALFRCDVHAVRFTPADGGAVYKLHLAVANYPDPAVEHCGRADGLCACYGDDVRRLDPPRLFDVQADPAERREIPSEQVPVAPSQMDQFELVVPRAELLPWGQLHKFRGADFDMHGLHKWWENGGSCGAVPGQCEEYGR
ncbi:arylsulfatase L-like [Pollicipes pollicipes]|uniref:arylsulfatase L-like n=1 Tax=Pollicipes pollicipes TaxID=41117 RepID=UPI0018854DE6|nr:arylsulfatase L-like [Pollicipes pollicipes]